MPAARRSQEGPKSTPEIELSRELDLSYNLFPGETKVLLYPFDAEKARQKQEISDQHRAKKGAKKGAKKAVLDNRPVFAEFPRSDVALNYASGHGQLELIIMLRPRLLSWAADSPAADEVAGDENGLDEAESPPLMSQ